jgi:uncharacterized alkaline shock family protein YloU
MKEESYMSDNDEVIKNEEQNEVSVMGNDTIKISNEVVATYAGIAVAEVEGVYAMAGGFAGITEAISGKKNLSKGIKVEVGEKSTKIDVNIIVEYGARIPDVAYEIQTRIKKTVESMTDLKVLEVNVHVQGVHKMTDKELEEKESENANENENIEE